MSVSYARMKACYENVSLSSLLSPTTTMTITITTSTTSTSTSNNVPKRAGSDDDWQMQLAFCKPRHNGTIEGVNCISQTWRMKERVCCTVAWVGSGDTIDINTIDRSRDIDVHRAACTLERAISLSSVRRRIDTSDSTRARVYICLFLSRR